MTVRELIGMVSRYELDPDATLMVRPLLKDKPRKVTAVVPGDGTLTLTCSSVSKPRERQRKPRY